MPSIRPIVLAVLRRGDALLVFEAHDDVKGETFCRPLGGGIEFGERSIDALKREFLDDPATARWVGLAEFREGRKILYPSGLVELLSADQ
ncbi:hypothetical protein PV458_10640 [Streptomyces sp. MN03-5084-2B]|nr:hypothetical protein [Streptomyces sp. MN03-5084-2B]